ncbi:FAD binding domain-containing protein [Haloferax namakaokahaiae]|uniref:FAD binding domain-containing protein n=1 Tax=Haloferax namakaokahaiae TaxID=1748331 RepID=A0ABD5ZJI6_9EURY
MKPAPFEQHEPTTVKEAVSLLESLDDRAILAGGQSMVPMLRFRLAVPKTIIDINHVEGLDVFGEEDGWLRIGALVRHADVEHSDLIAEKYGSFADTAPLVADPQIRNRGTVAGSVAQADPKGDWGSVLLAHEGEVVAHGPDGERTIPADEFFLLPYDTTLDENELVTELRVPVPVANEGSSYHKLKRKVGDYAMVGSAARLILDDDGVIETANIALTAVDITNVRATDAEEHLEGERPSSDLFKRAGELAAEQSNPEADEHGGVGYKERMVSVLTQRALSDAAERTGAVKRTVKQ